MNFRLIMPILAGFFSVQCASGPAGSVPAEAATPKEAQPEVEQEQTKKQESPNSKESAPVEKAESQSSAKESSSSTKSEQQEGHKGWAAITEALKKYQSASGVTANVHKSLHMSLLDKEKTSEGKFYLAKDLFRLDLEKPDKSTVVMDGEHVWVVNHFGDLVQVSKMKTSKLKKSSALLAVLFDLEEVKKNFEMKDYEIRDQRLAAVFVPRSGVQAGVTKLTMTVDLKTNQVEQVTYWDEIENKTRYSFKDIKFGAEVAKDKFTYTPPKDAEITEY